MLARGEVHRARRPDALANRHGRRHRRHRPARPAPFQPCSLADMERQHILATLDRHRLEQEPDGQPAGHRALDAGPQDPPLRDRRRAPPGTALIQPQKGSELFTKIVLTPLSRGPLCPRLFRACLDKINCFLVHAGPSVASATVDSKRSFTENHIFSPICKRRISAAGRAHASRSVCAGVICHDCRYFQNPSGPGPRRRRSLGRRFTETRTA